MFKRAFTLTVAVLLIAAFAFAADKPAKVVLISGKDSHGSGAHNWGDGVRLLERVLNEESGLNVQAEHHILWPKVATTFDDAATIDILSDVGGRDLILQGLADRG